VRRGWPLPLASIDNRRSVVGVDALCDCILIACSHERAAGELFLVADGSDCSTPDIVSAIARGLGRHGRLWPCPPGLLRLGAVAAGRKRVAESLCESLQVDAAKARRVLGWAPPASPLDGIERAAAAWRQG
jgi:nucleoside-diphosphate-sugar epimerase